MMKTLIKIISGLVLLVLLLVGAAVVALFTLNPNDYKPQIARAVQQATNRELTIAGDMSVAYYPVLGFTAANITLGNTPDFAEKDFIKAGEVQVGVKLLPLLSRKVEITSVRLIEPQITVIKRADGRNNLAMPDRPPGKGNVPQARTEDLEISVEGIEIAKARVTYIDKTTGATTFIDPLNLKIPRYAQGRAVDVALSMAITGKAGAKPTKLDVNTTVKPDLKNATYSLQNLKADIDLGGTKASATAAVMVDARAEQISVTKLAALWQGTEVTGNATIKGFKNPHVRFDLASSGVNLEALFPANPAAKADKNKPLLPLDLLRALTLEGAVKIGTLQAAGLRMSDVKFDVDADKGLLKINPLRLNMYDGTLSTIVQIDARGNSPAYNLNGTLKGLAVGKLLVAKMGEDYVTGISDVTFDLNSRGNTMNALSGNAGGMINFDFGKGYINKWQLSRLMNQAISYFENGQLDQNASDKIYFTSLDATFNGTNGVFRNDDLVLIGPKSHALGAGSVDLGAQRVDYVVKVGSGDNPEKFAKKKHLPVRMSGPFAKPSYAIDMQTLIEDVAGEKIEEKKQEVMQKLFESLDKKMKNEPAPSETGATDVPVEGATEGTAAPSAPATPAGDSDASPAQPATPSSDPVSSDPAAPATPEDALKSLLNGALGGR